MFTTDFILIKKNMRETCKLDKIQSKKQNNKQQQLNEQYENVKKVINMHN